MAALLRRADSEVNAVCKGGTRARRQQESLISHVAGPYYEELTFTPSAVGAI
jgi:hypothetical protein